MNPELARDEPSRDTARAPLRLATAVAARGLGVRVLRWLSRRPRPSLRLRLALCYGAMTTGVVVLACTYGYAVHSRTHYEQVAATFWRVASADTPGRRDTVLAAIPPFGLAVRLIDPPSGYAGRAGSGTAPPFDAAWARAATPAPAYPRIATLAPAVHLAHRMGGTFTVFRVASGERWRVLVMPRAASRPALALASPLRALDASVSSFGRFMMVVGAVGTLVTFGMAWWMAARVLRPVAVLTQTAEAIARSRTFGRRVPAAPAGGRRRDELGLLASTFNRMLASLEQAYDAQQRFVADASHELRAPLTAIRGNLELLRRPHGDAERAVAVDEASRETERLGRLVSDLLTLARADAGVAPLRREVVALHEVVTDAMREARHIVRGQTLSIDALEPLVVRGDPDRLLQLLLIALDNAAKYTPAGGRVGVALRRVGGAAEITVRDTGVGIAAEDLPHVFDRFYRADKSRSRELGGSGLGLSIAQWIADAHGGTIALDSTPGVGTVVRTQIPIAE